MRLFFPIGLLVVLLVVPGCDSGPKKARVRGSVSFDGKPIEEGMIELVPIDDTSGPSTGGMISGGKYEIAADRGPLLGGTYEVRIQGFKKTGQTVVDRDRPNAPPTETKANFIPAEFNSKSTLKVTVSSKSAEHNFDLTSP